MSKKCRILSSLIAIIITLSHCITVFCESPFDTLGVQNYIVGTNDGSILLAENEDICTEIAGLSRLAPMLIITEAIERGEFSLDTSVTVSAEAAKIPGPTAFLEPNETIDAQSLYKSAVIIAAGDACYALAEAIFHSMSVFTEKINERLSQLGVFVTYTTPLGDDTLMCAKDLYKIGCALSTCKTYLACSTCYMDTVIHENGNETELVNPNRLIRDLAGTSGLATGSSANAGYCGVISVVRGDTEYVCVVLGAKNSNERFAACKNAIEYVYASYKCTKIAKCGDVMAKDVSISGGMQKSTDLIALHDLSVQEKQNSAEFFAEINVPITLQAPIHAGDVVGCIDYVTKDGVHVATLELTVACDIPSVNFFDYVMLVMRCWVSG